MSTSPAGTITIDASTASEGVDFEAFVRGGFQDGETGGGFPVFDNGAAFSGEEMFIGYGSAASSKYVLAHGQVQYAFSTHTVAGTINTIEYGTLGSGSYDADGYFTGGNVELKITGLDLSNPVPTNSTEETQIEATGPVHNFALASMYGAATAQTQPRYDSFADSLDAYSQHFIGSAYGDTYTGTAYDDIIEGGGGNDIIDGGAGTDTYVFDGVFGGPSGTYSFTGGTNGNPLVVTDSRTDGTGADTLTNVEILKFDNLTYNLTTHKANYTPTDLALDDADVEASAAVGTVVGSLVVTDQDASDTYTYALLDDAGGLFVLDGASLKVAGALSSEDYTVRVQVTDSAGNTFEKDLAVNTVNAAPTNVALSASSIAENSANGTVVGALSATDPDGDAVTYSLTDNAGGKFALVTENGVTSLVVNGALNFETASAYSVTVKASDGNGGETSQSFAISVTDVNEAPTGLKLSSPITPSVTAIAVPENSVAGTVVATLSATDPEGGAVTYALTNDADGLFVIEGNQVKLAKDTGDFETATTKSYQIGVVASDAQGNSTASTAFNIKLADAYDEPEGTLTIDVSGSTEGVNFDTFIGDYYQGLSGGSFTFYGGTPVQSQYGPQNVQGDQISFSYKENGATSSDRVVLEGDGELAYDYLTYGSTYGHGISGSVDSLTFGQWVDGQTTGTVGTGDSGKLTGLDEQVKISGFDLSAEPGTGHVGSINLVYGLYNSVQTGNSAGIYSAMSHYAQNFIGSNGDDTYTGSQYNDTIEGRGGNDTVDGGAGTDTYVFDGVFGGPSGTYSFTGGTNGNPLVVTDSRTTGGTGVDTLTNVEILKFNNLTYNLTTHKANYAPTDLALDDAEVESNAPVGTVVGSLVVTDQDTSDTYTYALLDDAGGLFVLDGAALKVAGTLAQDDYTVKVRVTDSAGQTFEKELTVNGVLPATAPVITSNGGTASAAISIAENGTAVTTVAAADVDEGAVLAYSISGGADAALFEIDAATGVLVFKSAPDFEAPADAGANNVYDVVVRATDNTGLFDEQTLAVTVTDVQDTAILGTPGNDKLSGTPDNDTLDGLAGADTLTGGKGDDTYIVDNTRDKVVEKAGEGTDLVLSSVTYKLANNVENLTLTGASAINGTGNNANNVIIGNSAANKLSGGGGNDTLEGGAGNDTLAGGSGNDFLYGGLGADALNGNGGADTFVYKAVEESSLASFDTISGFSAKTGDMIDLSAIDANSIGGTDNDAFVYIGAQEFSGTAGELRFANGFLQGDTNGDGTADLSIKLSGVKSLSEGNIIL